jgi:MFS family permease
LVIASTTVVSHAFGRSSYGLLIPAIEESLELSHAEAGVGGTLIYGAFLGGTLLVASAGGRAEPITLMRLGLLVATVGLGLNAVAPSYLVLLLGLTLTGAAGAGIWVPAPTVATAGIEPERRGFVIGLLTATIGLGMLMTGVGTNLLRAVADDQALWRPVWALQSLVALVLLVLMIVVVRQEPTPPVEGGGVNLSLLRTLPGWHQLTFAYALYAMVGGGFFSFVVAALEQDGGLRRGTATAVFAAMGLAGAVAAPATGRLSDRVGRRPVMIGSVATVGVSAAAIASGSAVIVVIGALVFGAIASSFPTQVAAYVRDHAEAREFAAIFATILLFFSVAAIIAPTAMGWLADRTGSFTAPYLMVSGLSCAIIVALATLPGGPRSTVASERAWRHHTR